MDVELLGLPERLGRYELLRVLGRGGMGRVVLGHDPVLRRNLVLKLVEPTAVDPGDLAELRFMFHREARATAALRHPNIVEVFDYSGPEAEIPYLACELIEGPTLRQVLDVHASLAPPVAAALGYELAQALAHAHAAGIVHRDVKPENVFWTEGGRIVMGDFGIAKAFGGGTRLGGTVQFGRTSLYGSPAYMAPEQLTGSEIGPHTDLFALGSVLFECLAGVPAFAGEDIKAILDAVTNGRRACLPTASQVPPRLLAVVDRLLTPAPTARLAAAGELADALRTILDELGVGDPRRLLCSSSVRACVPPSPAAGKAVRGTAGAADPQSAAESDTLRDPTPPGHTDLRPPSDTDTLAGPAAPGRTEPQPPSYTDTLAGQAAPGRTEPPPPSDTDTLAGQAAPGRAEPQPISDTDTRPDPAVPGDAWPNDRAAVTLARACAPEDAARPPPMARARSDAPTVLLAPQASPAQPHGAGACSARCGRAPRVKPVPGHGHGPAAQHARLWGPVLATLLGALTGGAGAWICLGAPTQAGRAARPPETALLVEVVVETSAPKAELWVDGQARGSVTGRATLALPAGPHTLAVGQSAVQGSREVLLLAGTTPVFRF